MCLVLRALVGGLIMIGLAACTSATSNTPASQGAAPSAGVDASASATGLETGSYPAPGLQATPSGYPVPGETGVASAYPAPSAP